MTIRPVLRVHNATRVRRVLLGAAAALFIVGAAACGSSSAGSLSGPSSLSSALSSAASSGTHEFSASLSATGTVTQSTTFTETLEFLPSCSTLAKSGESGTWSIPQSLTNTSFTLNWNVTPYTGPGTYTDPKAFQDSVELDAPYQGSSDAFDQVSGTSLSITVNSDGSGSAKFTNLQDNDGLDESGTETWTCS